MDKLEKKMMESEFARINGSIMRAFNILEHRYKKLSSILGALKGEGVSTGQFIANMNFLEEEGYVKLRDIETRQARSISDFDYDTLEGKLSGKGLRLLKGVIDDDLVER